MKAIVAIDKLWGIGKNGKLLFRIKEDMGFFRKMTTNKVVVMGRKTFESLPNGEPLKNRTNLVITSNKSYKNHDNVIFGDINEINEEIKKYDTNDIFIIGGESIYEQFIHRCDTVYVTHNTAIYKADAYMPNLTFEGFRPKFITNKGKIHNTDNYWSIEEWITSECEPYRSILWVSDSNNQTLFAYSHNMVNWRSIYDDKLYALKDNFKKCFSSIISSRIKTTTVTKIHSYYRAETVAVKDNNIIRIASFGATEDDARSNLTTTVTNILK